MCCVGIETLGLTHVPSKTPTSLPLFLSAESVILLAGSFKSYRKEELHSLQNKANGSLSLSQTTQLQGVKEVQGIEKVEGERDAFSLTLTLVTIGSFTLSNFFSQPSVPLSLRSLILCYKLSSCLVTSSTALSLSLHPSVEAAANL